MAKWVVNTTEDFFTVEADYMTVGVDGTLIAVMDMGPNSGAWAKGFWLSYQRQEDTT